MPRAYWVPRKGYIDGNKGGVIHSVHNLLVRYHIHMNRFIFVGGSVAVFFFAYAAFAFTEPTGVPPQNNVPPPITVGSGRQVKAGDLTVQNIKASSITLGEDTRTTWLDAASACAWDGWKCDCKNDGSSGASIALTMGVQCTSGRLTDMKIVSIQISTKEKKCSATAPAPCKQIIYSYANASGDSGETVLDVISNLWDKWF